MKPFRLLGFLLLSFLLTIGDCRPVENQTTLSKAEATATITIDEVLWWLPEDTEVIAVTQRPRDKVSVGISGVAVASVKRGEFAKKLQQLSPQLILEGSRKFRTPRGLGMMTFEGCTVVITPPDPPADSELQKWLIQNANRTEQVVGFKTYILDEKIEQDQWHFLITQPRPNIWLCATNKKYLESVLIRRIRSKEERLKTTRALPETLPEWKCIDTDASEWALRHYRKDQALLDPTSPLSGTKRMATIPDGAAMGMTYSFNTDNNIATIYYLTAPKNVHNMKKVYRSFWQSFFLWMNVQRSELKNLEPTITGNPTGVIKMQFDFSKPKALGNAGFFGFGLLGLFGRAVIV
jgi:hypothetical protein